MKKLILTFILALFITVPAVYADTNVILEWSANTEQDLAGYRIYQDGILQQPDILCPANDKSCCTWTSEDLSEGIHEWYATAFDSSKNETGPSNTVSYNVDLTAPGKPLNITITINITVNPWKNSPIK